MEEIVQMSTKEISIFNKSLDFSRDLLNTIKSLLDLPKLFKIIYMRKLFL